MRRAGGIINVGGGSKSNPYYVISHQTPNQSKTGTSSLFLPRTNTRYLRAHHVNMWQSAAWGFPLIVKSSGGNGTPSPYTPHQPLEAAGSYFPLWSTMASSPVTGNWGDKVLVRTSGSGSLISSTTGTQFRFQSGHGKKAPGQRRISHDEREERRRPKSKEEKKAKELQLDELNDIVDTLHPQDSADIVETYKAKGERVRDLLSNFGAVLEKLDVDVQGFAKPMSQLATVTKENATTFHLMPHKAIFLSPIVTKILRMGEQGIRVEKESTGGPVMKVKVEVPQLTQERRYQSVSKLAEFVREGKGKLEFQNEQASTEVGDAAKKLAIGDETLKGMLEGITTVTRDNKELLEMEMADIENEILNSDNDHDTE